MCLFPITMRHPSTGEVVTFPCGKCPDCVARYQRDWSFRLSKEFECWSACYFLTLTYSNDNVPYISLECSDKDLDFLVTRISSLYPTVHLRRCRQHLTEASAYLSPDVIVNGIPVPTVCKDDVQTWIKVVRERYSYSHFGKRLNFKYFICSEYGPSTLRPHYHAIFFTDLPLDEFTHLFVESWQEFYGKVNWRRRSIRYGAHGVTDVMSYVAKYCCKPSFVESPYVFKNCVFKPFRIMSKGIGLSFYSTLINAFNDTLRRFGRITNSFLESFDNLLWYVQGNFRFRLPRYYVDRLFPQKTFETLAYDTKTQSVKIVRQTRKDVHSFLSQIYKAFMAKRIGDSRTHELQTVALQFFGGLSVQALESAEIFLRNSALDAFRKRCERLYSFYAKSFVYG